jgi:hypothetical protein
LESFFNLMNRKAPWTTMPGARVREPKTKPKWVQPFSADRRLIMDKLYQPRRVRWLARNTVCAVTGARATDVHHVRGRAGTLLIDERFWVPVSRAGHRWIEDNKELARKAGLLCGRGQWNVAPKDAVSAKLGWMIREVVHG